MEIRIEMLYFDLQILFKALIASMFVMKIIYLIFYCIELDEDYYDSMLYRTIEYDGFQVLYDVEYCENSFSLFNDKLERDILELLPENYTVMDYECRIINTQQMAFQRDITVSQYFNNTKFPTYTLLLYFCDDECLSICPNSHLTYPFVTSRIVNIHTGKGTAILLDSDNLYTTYINNMNNHAIMKYHICHYDDVILLSTMFGIRTEKNNNCTFRLYNKIIKKLSYYLSFSFHVVNWLFFYRKTEKNKIADDNFKSYIPITFYEEELH